MQVWKIKKSEKPTLEALYEKRQHESGMTKAQFAELIETSPAALSQLLGPNPHRNIGDKMARKIETALDLPFGWMDVLHASEEPSNVAFRGLNETKRKLSCNQLGKRGAMDGSCRTLSPKSDRSLV